MNVSFLSVYDYLSYILPGGVVLIAGWYSFFNAKYQEPGAFAAIILIVAAYILGQAAAVIWYWLEPIAWGHLPFRQVDRTWGLIGRNCAYPEDQRGAIEATFKTRYGPQAFQSNYDLGYTEIQQSGKGDFLAILNQQIGLFGHLSAACLIGVVLVAGALMSGKGSANGLGWAALLIFGTLLFGVRYKHFWMRFGDQVVRQVRLMAALSPK